VIVVVSCGARKRDKPSRAGDLYTGPYAGAALRWARSVAPVHAIFILSAKYGLVPHDRVIEPYEMTLRDQRAVGSDVIAAHAAAFGVAGQTDVIVVGGRGYVELARTVWPTARAPFAGLGMGRQMSLLRQSMGRVPAT
jgi:hypothetical protein